MSQIIEEKKIAYGMMIRDKEAAIVTIEKSLKEIKKENFHVRTLERSAPLDSISYAVSTLHQIAYVNSLVIIEDS